jgi:integration host factor subunit beta
VVKSELLFALNEKFPELLLGDVELALNCILGQMGNALVQGERIEIRGFGSFELRHRPPLPGLRVILKQVKRLGKR